MAPAPAKMTPSDQSLHSAQLELKYAQSIHAVEQLGRDEALRRLRLELHISEDDNDELRDLLQQEEDRSDAFERLVGDNLVRAEEAEAQLQALESELRVREAELQAVRAEREALQYTTADATAALTEKLALTRELSVLKPELEHLKAQAASSEALMAEKLALQRQLTEIQCEAENARREAKRALAKRRNTGVEIAQEEQVEDLRRQLAKERRARERAEQATETASGDTAVDEVRKQLAKERKARQKAEAELEASRDTTQIEDVRKDLLKEKKVKAKLEETMEALQTDLALAQKEAARAVKRAEGNANADGEAEELRNELAKEKKERTQAEKASKRAAGEFEAQKATLEDKLNQFRTKLKSTKDKLKDTEAQLTAARETAETTAVPKAAAASKPTTTKNTKKRNVAQSDPDATTLGTPGDGPTAKRARKAASGVGDKSTFSITPFLNKTVGVVQEGEDAGNDSDQTGSDNGQSPAAQKTKKTNGKQPLAEQPASSVNANKARGGQHGKQLAKQTLEMVTEEQDEDVHSQGQENHRGPQTLKVKTKDIDGPEKPADASKEKKKKARKSILDIPELTADAEVRKQKKKRKLGGLGKTLFDEDDDDAAAGAASRPLFGTRVFGGGVLGGGKKGGVGGGGGIGGSFLGGKSKLGSTLLTANDGSGFQFSPLKKARRNLDDTLRG